MIWIRPGAGRAPAGPGREHCAGLAGVRSELTATHAAIEAERNHGAQWLADQQARYEDLITELRAAARGWSPTATTTWWPASR